MLEMNMELTKIEIENSKSIKSPITISFTEGLPTILIGKNGCGKTNILEALSYIVWGRPWYPDLQNVEFPKYRAYIQISKKEVIPTHIKYDKSKGEIVAYDIGKGLEIDRLEEHLPPLIKEQCAKISELISKLQETLGKYKEQIEKIAHKGNGFESKLCCYQIYDNENRLTTYTKICSDTELFIKNIERSIGKVQEKLSLDEEKIRFTHDSTIYFTPELNFKLEYVEPNISEFAQSFVSIDKEAIKCAIEEINKQTKDSCECMEKLIKEINEIKKRAEDNLLSFSASKDWRNEQYDSILRKVKKAIAKKCQFLRNESQDVIFRNHLQESRLRNASEIIMETYFCKVYDGPDKDKLSKEIREGNIPHIQEQDIKDFENFLNNNIPNFDKGMYKSISVVKNREKHLDILLNEKTGDTVELDKTSAGRRWYFTYYFMKSILRPGDMFIIDEPASGLHPCAQSDILKELMQLSKSGIKVVYSTHSPYLIPKEEWKSVHFVTMMDDGTQVNSVSSNKEVISQMKDVFAEDIFYIQYVFELYIKGDKHKIAENCYKAVKEKDKTLENAAREMAISKTTIESWNRNGDHFRSPEIVNVFQVSRYVNIDIKDLLN